MIYPHNESRTYNLTDSYKNELEAKARKKYKCKYQQQAINFLLDTNTFIQVIKTHQTQSENLLQDVYSVSIGKAYSNELAKSLTHEFKNSVADTDKKIFLEAYDVLAYFSMYSHNFYSSADDVYAEFGEMVPSQAQAVFEESLKTYTILTSLYNKEQLDQLAEIQ